MNQNALKIFKSMSYTITSNLLSFIISTIFIIIIPKLFGLEQYGYWQLYMFFSSYVGFMHLGWNDGIYLRFGGEKYENLNKGLFFSQFIELLMIQILFGILIWIFSIFLAKDSSREFVVQMVAISMILVNTRLMLLYILQATNRIKEYAQLTMIDRVIFIVLVIAFLFVGINDYIFLIVADLMGKFISLILAALTCKNIVFRKINTFFLTIREAVTNIIVGSKLMFATIASMLIIGIVRFGIESSWDVSTFGKVSLTLSISNMMMIFFNAVGVIMFPMLRRTKQERFTIIYSILRDYLMVLLLGALVIYYPLNKVMVAWLPQYADSLRFMALLFPIIVYEGKMALLINTYMKTLRREKTMLRINLVTMILSLIMTIFSTRIYTNLDMTVFNIVILLAVRSTLAEKELSKDLDVKIGKDIILETFLIAVFISTGWFINSWVTVLIYCTVYSVYLLIKRSDLKESLQSLKVLIKA